MARPLSQYVFDDDFEQMENLDEYDYDEDYRAPSPAPSRHNFSHGPLPIHPHDDGTTPAHPPTTQALLNQADAAMSSLRAFANDSDNWKPVLTHKNGAIVYRVAKNPKGAIPVFKGVAIIHGFAPEAIFGLIKNRSLWDNWYLEGHIVENINDSTCLSYMVMKPQTALSQALATTRDLALIDRRELDHTTGTIAYASTSVETSKIPKHPGRVRAFLKLNGWILEPHVASDGITISTKISYYCQTDVGGLLPNSLVKRYLARRALVVVGVEEYLRKHGPPPVADSTAFAVRRARTMSMLSTSTEGDASYPERLDSLTMARNPAERRPSFAEARAHYSEGEHHTSLHHGQPPRHSQQPVPRSVLHQPQMSTLSEEPKDLSETGSAEDMAYAEEDDIEEVVVVEEDDDDDEIEDSQSSESDAPAAVDGPSTSPHNEAAQSSLRLLKSLEPEQAGWVFHSQNNGVRISQKTIEGASMPMVRGDAIIQGPWSVQEILSVIKSTAARRSWDARFEDGRPLVHYNLEELLIYSSQKGTFPVSGRDFVTTNMTDYDAATGAVYYIATSVVDPAAPADPKKVRAHLTVAGWILKPVDGGIEATYIVQVDIKGSVPSSIIKVIQTQTPLCIAEVFKYVEHKGFIPFVVRKVSKVNPGRDLVLRSEDFDPKGSVYTLEYRKTDTCGQSVTVALPKSVYSNGGELQVSPNDGINVVKVVDSDLTLAKTAVSEKSVLVRITVEKAGDVDVSIKIKPAKGAWTVNGQKLEDGPLIEASQLATQKAAVKLLASHVPRVKSVKALTPVTRDIAPSAEPTTGLKPTASQKSESGQTTPPAARPTYVPHRHTESGVKALKYLKQLMTDEGIWKPHSEQQGVKVSTIEEPGSTMPVVRGDAVFPPEYTVDEIVNVIKSTGARKIWDGRFEDGDLVEWLNPNEMVFRSLQKGQFPVSGRDLCGLQVTIFDARSSTTYIVATSVVDPLVPINPKRVRAELTVAGWVLQPATSGQGTSITYIVKIDPKGSIPSAIVKAVSIQTPLGVAEVLKYLRTHGSPPAAKVLGNTGEGIKLVVGKDHFDHKNSSFELEYTVTSEGDPANHTGLAGLVELQIDTKMYPSGVDLEIPAKTVQDYLTVKSSPDGKFVRLYMNFHKVRAAGTVQVSAKVVKKKKGAKGEFTVNGAAGSVGVDKSNKVMIPVRKNPTVNKGVSGAARQVRQAPVAGGAATERITSSETANKAAVKQSALAANSPSPAAAVASSLAGSQSSVITRSERSRLPTYLLAFLSMILRLLRPFLAPNAPDLPDTVDPLDIRALIRDSNPLRLTGAASVGLVLVGFFIHSMLRATFKAIGGIFGFFTFAQWILLIAMGAGAFYLGTERNRRR